MATTLKDLPEYGGKVGFRPQVFVGDDGPISAVNCLEGLKVIVDENLPQSRKWAFPYDRFIQYGPKDEWWAIPWGFGHWKYKPVAYQMILHGEWTLVCNEAFKNSIGN